MILTNHITEDGILLDMELAGKAEAIERLARLVLRGRTQAVVSAAIQQLLAREAIESTGIGRGIAIPHARVVGLKDLICAVGRVTKGLDFRSVDKEPVRLIFLICYPPARQTLYLNFIATLARLLHEDAHTGLLLNTTSPAEVFATLGKISALPLRPDTRRAGAAQGPEPHFGNASSRALDLLARLELCEEMLASAGADESEIKKRIENISALVDPQVLEHYRRLKRRSGPAVVVVEGGVCQGCLMRLPSQFVQSMRRQRDQIQLCSHCKRFVYQI